MILTDDNFVTIVEAVKQGRSIYDNIRKAIHFLIATNIGEIVTIFLGLILGSIPSLFKQIHKEQKFHLSFLFYTLLSFGFGLFLFLLEKQISHTCLGAFEPSILFLFLSIL